MPKLETFSVKNMSAELFCFALTSTSESIFSKIKVG